MNKKIHLDFIEKAIEELMVLHKRALETERLPHRYIGSIISSTAGFLVIAANSLDGGNRFIIYEKDTGGKIL